MTTPDTDADPDRIILVHRLPKVGGTSALDSIIKAFWPEPQPYATHTLTQRRIEQAERWHRENEQAEPAPWIEKARRLRSLLDRGCDIHWQVVTLVRDPIAREVSQLFHHSGTLFPDLIADTDPEKIRQLLRMAGDQLDQWFEHDNALVPNWFDEEIRDVFGIDLLAQPFDPARGYGVYRHGKAAFLATRQEDLERVFVEAATPFLDPPKPLVLERKNVGAEKPYAAAYRAVLEQLVLPRPLCERIYNAKWVRHFYSEEERANFIARWSGARPQA